MIRARFAPSPTGYLHIGSARTFIFNWLYVRKNGVTMVLRIDNTDVDRNTEASLNSIYEDLNWLDLEWDEFYRQSERLDSHRKLAYELFAKGLAYRDFTPAVVELEGHAHIEGPWLCNPEMRNLSERESNQRAESGEPFVIRFRVQREPIQEVKFTEEVYGEQSKLTADIEDFALLRSNGMPTYHLASCADDIDLKITHVIFSEADPIDPKALWLNTQHLRSVPVEQLAPLVRLSLEEHHLQPYGDDTFFLHVVDTIRTRYTTLLDFSTKGRAYFADDFHIEDAAKDKLDAPGARELLRELAGRLAASPDFSEGSVEAELRKLAEERGVRAGLHINASRAALTGQTVGPSAFAVFVCIGRERVIERLRKV